MSEWFGHEPYIPNPSGIYKKDINYVATEEEVNQAKEKTMIDDDCGYDGGKWINTSVSSEVPIEVKVLCNETCRKQMDYYEDTIVKLNDMNRHLKDKVTLYTILTYFFALTTGLPLLYMMVEYLTLKGIM